MNSALKTDAPKGVASDALTLSLIAAAQRLGIGLSTMKALAARGEVRSIRIGRRRLITAQSLHDYIARLAAQ